MCCTKPLVKLILFLYILSSEHLPYAAVDQLTRDFISKVCNISVFYLIFVRALQI